MSAYVYKLIEQSTGKWYIGSRTKSGCHPDDGYMSSSKIVKQKVSESPDNWSKVIIAVGESADMIELETTLLKESDAKNNQSSYNQHNGDGKFSNAGRPHTDETRRKISESNKGKPRLKSESDEEKRIQAVKLAIKGKPQSFSHKAKRAAAMLGKAQSPEHIEKRRAAIKAFYERNK
jgi:hypothetical protein